MAETQRNLTPMQRYVYMLAKDHHTDDYDAEPTSSMRHGHQATSGF